MSASSPCVTCGTLSQERCRCGPDRRLMRGSGFVSTGPNFEKSTAGISGMPIPPATIGVVPGVAAGPRRKALTSSAVIRPFSPVPFSFARSTSSSRPKRRTEGLACTPAKSVGAAERAVGEPGWGGGGAACCGCGAGSCCAMTDGGGVTGASPEAFSARNRKIGTPSLTRSPTLTRTSSTVPAWVAGTSMVALSDSSETRGSSTLTLAPAWTWSSITGTSLKSPMSGTLMSLIASILAFLPMRVFRAASNHGGVRLLRIDAVAADRLGEHAGWQCALLHQRLQRAERHPASVHLKEVAKPAAIVGPAEAIGAQYPVTLRHKGADLVGEEAHIVRGRD